MVSAPVFELVTFGKQFGVLVFAEFAVVGMPPEKGFDTL